MPHWNHAETPFGNIVYQISSDGSVYVHGVGTLDAERALTTIPAAFGGDPVPDWGAMKAEARRMADEAGAPLESWYTPNPPLVVNGKSYSDGFTVAADAAYVHSGNFTDAARRKLGAWFADNWAALAGGKVGTAAATARARGMARRTDDAVTAARKALAEAEAAHVEACNRLRDAVAAEAAQ